MRGCRGMVLFLLAATGCSFSPHLPAGGKITCGSQDKCPSQFPNCFDGTCHSFALTNDGGGTGGSGGGGSGSGADGAVVDQSGPVDQMMSPDAAVDRTAGDGGADLAVDLMVDQSVDHGLTDVPVEVGPPPDWPVCTPSSAGDVLLSSGLIVYLQLDEGTSNPVLNDSSTYDLGVTVNNLSGGGSWVSGRFGKGLSLAGGNNGAWIAVGGTPPSPVLNAISDGLSLSLWAKFPPGTPKDGVLLSRRYAGALGFLYRISVSAGSLRFEIYSTNGNHADYTGNQKLPTNGKWMHIAATYGDSGAVPGLKLYVNGVSHGGQMFGLSLTTENTLLLVGAAETPTAPMPETTIAQRLQGALDEVAVYNRPLNLDEIQALSCGARPN
ncbi:MAG TPA: LamG domain-containing protein [Polyangia bacterium]|nr:LamG domain-containing protein [Polyangia bacterium]